MAGKQARRTGPSEQAQTEGEKKCGNEEKKAGAGPHSRPNPGGGERE